jgi:uncharacterized membrane protein
MNERTLLVAFALANAVWTLCLVAAPLTLTPATVQGLDGRANVIDYSDRWEAMPLFARIVYTAGDLNCHQMASRSWTLGGNQIPVDVRMFAGFLLGNVGFGLALARPGMRRYRDAAAQFWPAPLRARLDSPARRLGALAWLWTAAITPALIDVAVQMFTGYESTNANRFMTGALLGVLGGFLIGALLRSLMHEPTSGALAAPAPNEPQA